MSTTCGMLQLAAQALDSPKRASLSYANAGHDLPYLRHGGDCEELMARGMPLGLMSKMSYEERGPTRRGGQRAVLQRRDGRSPRP
jgi:hypothetical protein